MRILGLDPGYERSALLGFYPDLGDIVPVGILSNAELLLSLRTERPDMPGGLVSVLVVEKMESFGMAVGKEVLDTVLWSGKFLEAWGGATALVPRREVKLNLCGSSRANDSNIRRALMDRFGAPGTKKAPGTTYGLKGDLWSALAVAVTYYDRSRPGLVAVE